MDHWKMFIRRTLNKANILLELKPTGPLFLFDVFQMNYCSVPCYIRERRTPKHCIMDVKGAPADHD